MIRLVVINGNYYEFLYYLLSKKLFRGIIRRTVRQGIVCTGNSVISG
jgi:hypothetical protein